MSNTATFSLNIRDKARDKMDWVLREFQFLSAISHGDTLEVSCHSLVGVLLPALESMEGKRYTIYRSYSTNIYIQIENH